MTASTHIATTILAFGMLLSACGPAGQTGPDGRSSQDVLATAQARAEATRAATFQTPPPTPAPPTATLTLETATPEATITPTLSAAMAMADYNAYVRSGPDESFSHLDFFLEGQQATILGRFNNTVSGTWYYIDPVGEGLDGWIWSGAVTASGDIESVPSIEVQIP